MILWELLAEQEPFPEYTRKQLINDIVQQGHRPVIPLNNPDDIAELILKCWNPDPSQRPNFAVISNTLTNYDMFNL